MGSMKVTVQSPFPQRGPTSPATSITLSGIFPEARAYLERHGCIVTMGNGEVTIVYPEGATSTELYPRTRYERYEIKLPDGIELHESRPRFFQGENCLYLPADAKNEP